MERYCDLRRVRYWDHVTDVLILTMFSTTRLASTRLHCRWNRDRACEPKERTRCVVPGVPFVRFTKRLRFLPSANIGFDGMAKDSAWAPSCGSEQETAPMSQDGPCQSVQITLTAHPIARSRLTEQMIEQPSTDEQR